MRLSTAASHPLASALAVQPKHRRIRRWDVLWAVFNMGVRFMELYKRRMKRIEVYQK
jgi:hypothetical protein